MVVVVKNIFMIRGRFFMVTKNCFMAARESATVVCMVIAVSATIMMTHMGIMQGAREADNLSVHGYNEADRWNEQLCVAAQDGDIEAVRRLVNGKANVNCIILAFFDYHVYADDELTPLICASKAGHVAVVKELLAAKACTDDNHRTEHALRIACEKGHAEVVQILLAEGVKTIDRFGRGPGPLMMAVACNHVEVVKVLCAGRADVNITPENCDGDFPLKRAAKRQRISVARELIRAGADINKQNEKTGDTVLHAAIERYKSNHDSESTIRMLVLAGAQHTIKNKVGQTAWDIALPELRRIMQQAEQERERLERDAIAAGQDVQSILYAAAFVDVDEDEKKAGEAAALQGVAGRGDKHAKIKEKKAEKAGERNCVVS